MRRYLADWLVQSSHESLLQDLQVVLDLCQELGIVINLEKSNLVPSQVVQYLRVIINTQSFVASPSRDRVSRLLSTAGEFLSSASPPATVWLSLLGMLSSLAHLVPGGRLRMRSLQICLHLSWNRVDQSTPVPWSPDCLRDLQWWLRLPCLSQGVSLRQVSPDLDFWSDALGVGWGAHLSHLVASGLWDESEARLSINARELLAVRRGLLHFQSSLLGKTVAVFCDNVTAVAYLHKEGGTRSPFLNSSRGPPLVGVARHPSGSAVHPGLPQRPSGHSVSSSPAPSYRVVPQHGGISIFVLSVASPDRLICHLRESPLFDLFLSIPRPSVSGHGRLSPILGRSSSVRFSSVVHHSPGSSQASGVSVDGAHAGGSVLASEAVVSDLLQLSLAPPVVLPDRPDLLLLPRFRLIYQGLHRLQLHAWRFSGASPERRVSRLK